MEIVGLAKVHGYGRVQLPKRVREILKVQDGDYVVFILDEDKIILKKSTDIFKREIV